MKVWVAMSGMDSEGGSVLGVTATAEQGMALADKEGRRPLDWEQVPVGSMYDGVTALWVARTGSASWAEVACWDVAADGCADPNCGGTVDAHGPGCVLSP